MEKELVLIVEDNKSILFNLTLMLEFNNFTVITAGNGVEALETLDYLDNIPDIILSDILMPEMNGYQLLERLSINSSWNMIPFIFFSAKTSPEDIKLGKLLGADDYLTKPIDEELLVGLIKKKIYKKRQLELGIKSKLESEIIWEHSKNYNLSIENINKNSICLFIVEWDENLGPVVTKKCVESPNFKINLDDLGLQLFQSTVSLFGQQGIIEPETILLNVRNFHMKAMVFFDSIPDNSIRGNQKQIMISVISPEISYLDSLKLKNTLFKISSELKLDNLNDLSLYYHEVQSILVKI